MTPYADRQKPSVMTPGVFTSRHHLGSVHRLVLVKTCAVIVALSVVFHSSTLHADPAVDRRDEFLASFFEILSSRRYLGMRQRWLVIPNNLEHAVSVCGTARRFAHHLTVSLRERGEEVLDSESIINTSAFRQQLGMREDEFLHRIFRYSSASLVVVVSAELNPQTSSSIQLRVANSVGEQLAVHELVTDMSLHRQILSSVPCQERSDSESPPPPRAVAPVAEWAQQAAGRSRRGTPPFHPLVLGAFFGVAPRGDDSHPEVRLGGGARIEYLLADSLDGRKVTSGGSLSVFADLLYSSGSRASGVLISSGFRGRIGGSAGLSADAALAFSTMTWESRSGGFNSVVGLGLFYGFSGVWTAFAVVLRWAHDFALNENFFPIMLEFNLDLTDRGSRR